MANNVSKAVGKDYRALVIPDPRWDGLTSLSNGGTLTQANPRPTVVRQSGWTGLDTLVLEASGANTTPPSLQVYVTEGGMPGLQGARVSFVDPAATQNSMYGLGWEAPTTITRVESYSLASGADYASLGGCLRLQNNAVLVSYVHVLGAGTRYVKLARKTFDTAGYAGTSATVKWQAGAVTTVATSLSTLPYTTIVPGTTCLLQLPEGRIQVYWVELNTAVTGDAYYQVGMATYEDEASVASGTSKSKSFCCLNQTIRYVGVGGASKGFTVDRMRVGYSNGQVLLLIHGVAEDAVGYLYTDTLWQYASSDLGNTFDRIDITNGATTDNDGGYVSDNGNNDHGAAFHDIAIGKDGSFLVSYNMATGAPRHGTGSLAVKRLGTAYTAWNTVDPVVVLDSAIGSKSGADHNIISTNTSIAVDETGEVAVTFQKTGTGTSGVFISQDHGVSWLTCAAIYRTQLANPAATDWQPWWASGDTTYYPNGYCTTFQCGRLLVFAQMYSGTEQDPVLDRYHLYEIDLGGYSSTIHPFKRPERLDQNMVMLERNWTANKRLADTTGWTFAGTGTETVGVDYSTLATAAGQTIQITNTYAGAVTSGEHRVMAMFECKVTAGNSWLEVLVGDGANVTQVYLEFSATNFMVKDVAAGTTLYNAASPAPAGWNQVFFVQDRSTLDIHVWVRASEFDREVRDWAALPTYQNAGYTITTAAAATASRFRVNQSANSTSYWKQVHFGSGPYGYPSHNTNDALSASAPYGRALTNYPVQLFCGDGVRVRAVDGPAYVNTSYIPISISTRYEYATENVLTSIAPSPRRTWRSTTTASDQSFIATLDLTADPGPFLGPVLAICAFNCNFQQLQVHYRTSAGAGWTALGTLLFNQGQTGLKWIRDGHFIRPNTAGGSTSASDYFTYNILEDSHFALTKTVGNVTSTVVRRIDANSEGAWTNGTATRTRLYCSGIDGTEDASGTSGEIWSKDGVLLIHDIPDVYQLKFTVPAGDTAEGYFEIGSLVVGHVAYFGRQYSRGRALTMAPNSALTTARSGARIGQSLGPSRRGVEFSWANENETDTTQLATSPPDVDYILPATGATEGVGGPADTGWKMMGMVEALRGSTTPVVYLSKVPMVGDVTTDTVQVNRNLFMLGRVVSDPRIDTVAGNEFGSPGELVRIATVSVEEEV